MRAIIESPNAKLTKLGVCCFRSAVASWCAIVVHNVVVIVIDPTLPYSKFEVRYDRYFRIHIIIHTMYLLLLSSMYSIILFPFVVCRY